MVLFTKEECHCRNPRLENGSIGLLTAINIMEKAPKNDDAVSLQGDNFILLRGIHVIRKIMPAI